MSFTLLKRGGTLLTSTLSRGHGMHRGVCARFLSVSKNELKMFPEYVEAMDKKSQGQVKQSIPLLNRVHEVVQQYIGPETPTDLAIRIDIAEAHRHVGQWKAAIDILAPRVNIDQKLPQQPQSEESCQASQLLSSLHLCSNDPAQAFRVADYAKKTKFCVPPLS